MSQELCRFRPLFGFLELDAMVAGVGLPVVVLA